MGGAPVGRARADRGAVAWREARRRLFTQDEIEIARASGERLIDTQASVEMAQRLMLLQRRRMVESQVLDRRARRVLHDDVLPQLHTAMLALSGPKSKVQSPKPKVQSPKSKVQ